MWYLIDTGYACAGIEIENEIVVQTAPIFRWMIGKPAEQVFAWKRIIKIEEVN